MEFRSLTTCVLRMFSSHYLKKPLRTISDIDINIFISSINRFGTRSDVARQVLFILFGRIHKDYDLLLGIVVGWMTLTRINNFQAVLNFQLPEYNIMISDWRIIKTHTAFMPDQSIIEEIHEIIYITFYKWARQSKRCIDENILHIWPNRRVKRRKIPGDESQPMDMVPTQPLKQVPQQPSTTPMQIPEALRIFDPTPDREVGNINDRGGKKFQNVSQPQFNKWKSESNLERSKTIQYYNAQEILNAISPETISSLTERFKAFCINANIELLKTIANLVFEKAIEKPGFAPLCSYLCSGMQSVQVISNNGEKVTFNNLIIRNCESFFGIDMAQEMNFAKKLTACKDLEKKKKLQLDYEKYKRISRERSVRNCRFMGELFKQKILTPNTIMYRIEDLITKRVEEPLECLCILLKTVGKELEQVKLLFILLCGLYIKVLSSNHVYYLTQKDNGIFYPVW